MKEDCGKEKYFGPLGKCEDCGKICDPPSHYPESCKTLCPEYIPKDFEPSGLTPTPSSLSSTSLSFQAKTLLYAFVGVALILLVTCILRLVWKKFLRRRSHEFFEERRRRKLPVPTTVSSQEHTDEREQIVPLNHIFEDSEANSSIIGDFDNDGITSINDINMERISNSPGATEQSGSTGTDTLTVTDEISHASSDEDFNFGQTFPFHSLPSLESAFENNTDQTQRKLRATN